MFRLHLEDPPASWRRFRVSMYLSLLVVLPVEVAGVASAEPGFARGLLFVLPFTWAVTVFGVEFTVRTGRQPETVAFDPEAVRFSGGGNPAWEAPWSRVREVRVRTGGGRLAPEWVAFRFRSPALSRILRLSLPEQAPLAQRVAGTVARYAPSVRISGSPDGLAWDARLAGEGDETALTAGLGPRFFRTVAVAAPAAGLSLSVAGFITGVVPRGTAGLLVVAAYVGLGLLQVSYNGWAAQREVGRPRGPGGRTSGMFLVLAGIIVVLEGIVGSWFLVAG